VRNTSDRLKFNTDTRRWTDIRPNIQTHDRHLHQQILPT